MSKDFEALPSAVERDIVLGDKSAKYRFSEPCAETLERLFDTLDANGNVDPEKAKGLRFRVIAAIVSRQDGSAISVEEAGRMRNAVAKLLYDNAMDVIGYNEKKAEAQGNA
jgi:hypothetical protein